ncbi:hypothetical protein Droror1_Dr00013978 [Drosera rotundifolia]
MGAKGRGSANAATVMAAAMVVLVLVQCGVTSAATTYTVGGTGGWTFNVVGWPKGRRFRVGDTLVFNYNSAFHDLVPVNKAAYDSCSAPASSKVLHSGNDQVKLRRGTSYFICSFPGHCQGGMKIAVTAT